MARQFVVLVVITQSLLLPSCALIPRRPVLTAPIRFEKGFAFTKSFTVGTPSRYMLLLTFNKGTPLAIRLGSAPEQFNAEFSITSDTKVVKAGTSESNRPQGTFKSNYTARDLAIFDAQAGTNYELSFRITKADPILLSTNPVVTIWIVPPGSL